MVYTVLHFASGEYMPWTVQTLEGIRKTILFPLRMAVETNKWKKEKVIRVLALSNFNKIGNLFVSLYIGRQGCPSKRRDRFIFTPHLTTSIRVYICF